MSLAYFPPPNDPATVWTLVTGVLQKIGNARSIPLAEQLMQDVAALFEGRHPDFQPIDMRYHDLEHTLQATACAAKIVEGATMLRFEPLLSQRDCEILLAAVLLHDTGFLKRRSDTIGTGAKYTLVHEARSCEYAAAYLPHLGFSDAEIIDVTAAIRCTGPGNRIQHVTFRRSAARTVASILVTADYLGQMAASDYVYELPVLYHEFEEGYDYAGIPPADRPFHSAADLIRKTPEFWSQSVRPMLDANLEGVYRHIVPLPDGANPYIVAVERNIVLVRSLAEAPDISLDPFPSAHCGKRPSWTW